MTLPVTIKSDNLCPIEHLSGNSLWPDNAGGGYNPLIENKITKYIRGDAGAVALASSAVVYNLWK